MPFFRRKQSKKSTKQHEKKGSRSALHINHLQILRLINKLARSYVRSRKIPLPFDAIIFFTLSEIEMAVRPISPLAEKFQ